MDASHSRHVLVPKRMRPDANFSDWIDRIAWTAIAGIIAANIAWACWITQRVIDGPTARDLQTLVTTIRTNCEAIHALDKTVTRLTERIEHIATTPQPAVKPITRHR